MAGANTRFHQSTDELLSALQQYTCKRRSAAGVAEQSQQAASEAVSALTTEVLHLPSPASCGAPASELLRCIMRRQQSDTTFSPPECSRCMVWLHGFPDQSLDHRKECSSYGHLHSKLPIQLAESFLLSDDARSSPAAFVAFNFSGTPGSDAGFPFEMKTVSREVEDARVVLRHLRRALGGAAATMPIHFVGISTGAIVASLLRGCDDFVTVTALAGLVDVAAGLHYDFSDEQLADFTNKGWCAKEFWLPMRSPSNPSVLEEKVVPEGGDAVVDDGTGDEERWVRRFLRLEANYMKDFLALDVLGDVARHTSPMLVVHGDRDRSVPVSNGEELFAAAADPKWKLIVKGGDHLMRSSKHRQKAVSEILRFAAESVQFLLRA